MRPRLLPLWSAALALSLCGLKAQESPLNDRSPEYQTAVLEAVRSYSKRDFKTSISLIDRAEKIYAPTAMTVNIRAAIAIEEKRFAEGRELCLKALNIDPKFFPALFNLAEIPFMQGKYGEARLAYEKLQEDQPKDDLIKFRMFLTYLLEKNEEKASAALEKIPLLNDTPIYFYAHAAWEFAHGNKKGGMENVESADTVFPPVKTRNFVGVFYDLGWLERPTAPAEPAPAPAAKPQP